MNSNIAENQFEIFKNTVGDQINRNHKTYQYYNSFIEALKSNNSKQVYESIVVEALDLIIDNKTSEFRSSLSIGTELYRARKIDLLNDFKNFDVGFKNEDRIYGFDFCNSIEPPLHLSPEGRNNVKGMSYLYLASNPYTACCEVRPMLKDLISIAKFKTKYEFKIIDLSSDKSVLEFKDFKDIYGISPSVLITNIMLEFCQPLDAEYGYLASQFISDYFRKTGIDGIRYKSFLGDADNITIFNSYIKYFDFIRSDIVYLWKSNNYFFEYSTNKEFNSKESFLLNEDDKDKLRYFIKTAIDSKIR